jgi:hypothetical protein
MTNSDYFQRDSDVARVNTAGKPGKKPHGDDYFRHDCEVVRVKKDGNDSSQANDDYFRHDDQVARVNDGDESDGAPSNITIRDAIRENALGPKKVTGDAGSVEQHPLKDQIEAEKFLASKEASRRPGLGIRLTKIVPDGTV